MSSPISPDLLRVNALAQPINSASVAAASFTSPLAPQPSKMRSLKLIEADQHLLDIEGHLKTVDFGNSDTGNRSSDHAINLPVCLVYVVSLSVLRTREMNEPEEITSLLDKERFSL